MAAVEQSVVLRMTDIQHGMAETWDDQGQHWLLIGLTPETHRQIEELAMRTGDSKADLINKALGLFKAASDAVRQGKFVGITDGEEELETEFVGF